MRVCAWNGTAKEIDGDWGKKFPFSKIKSENPNNITTQYESSNTTAEHDIGIMGFTTKCYEISPIDCVCVSSLSLFLSVLPPLHNTYALSLRYILNIISMININSNTSYVALHVDAPYDMTSHFTHAQTGHSVHPERPAVASGAKNRRRQPSR